MAVNNLGRTYQSSVDVSISGNPPKRIQTYTQQWLIKLDDPCTEEAFLGTAPGLPYVGQASYDIPGFYCLSRSFTESTDVPGLYTCLITWSTDMSKFLPTGTGSPSSGGSRGNDGGYTPDEPPGNSKDDNADISPETPPWMRPALWSMSTTYETTLATHAIFCGIDDIGEYGDGKSNLMLWHKPGDWILKDCGGSGYLWVKLTNSAAELIYSDKEDAQLEYQVAFACRQKHVSRASQPLLVNCINDRVETLPITNIEYKIGELWYKSLSVTADFFENDEYREVFYNISMTFATNTTPGGWREGLADIGGRYYASNLTSDTDLSFSVKFRDEEGNPVQGWLNGFGGKAYGDDRPATIWWSKKQFNNLGPAIEAASERWD